MQKLTRKKILEPIVCKAVMLLLMVVILNGFALKGFCELLAYEGFDYSQSTLANSDGGLFWAGSWYGSITAASLSGSSNCDIDSTQSLTMDNLPFRTNGGHLNEPIGGSGKACRMLPQNATIDLDKNQTYYISYLFRRNDNYDGGADEWTAIKLWDIQSSSAKHIATIGTGSDESWFFEKIGVNASSAPNAFNLNTTYFVVVKIVAEHRQDPADSDQMFLKAYGPGDVIDLQEQEIDWTFVGKHDQWNTTTANCIEISGGSATGYSFDEIRIGLSWSSVVPINTEIKSLMAYDTFDYAKTPLSDQLGGFGFNGCWYKNIGDRMPVGAADIAVDTEESLRISGVKFLPTGGMLKKPLGEGNMICRALCEAAMIDMNREQDYYISFLFRRDDNENINADEWFVFRLWNIDGDEQTKILELEAKSDESWALNHLGTTAITDENLFELNQTYFVVIKISAASDYDQAFLKVYGPGDTIDQNDYGIIWTLEGAADENEFRTANLIQLAADDHTGISFDELRIAGSWDSVIGRDIADPGNKVLLGDIDGDNSVNFNDLFLLIDDWLK